MLFFAPFVFALGLIIGSFLNCLIYFLEGGRKNLLGRSFCPACRRQLSTFDLVPVLSFVFLKGRCRHCQKKISWQYPLVESATGLIFLLIFLNKGGPMAGWQFLNLVYLLFIASCLIAIFVFDLKHYLIPDEIVYPALAVSGLWHLAFGIFFHSFPGSSLFAAVVAGAFFWVIYLITKGKGMGFGDVKLALFMGLFLGFPKIMVALFLAFFFGAIIGLGLVFSGRKHLKSELPFGPFLVSGTFFALFLGQQIANYYSALLRL